MGKTLTKVAIVEAIHENSAKPWQEIKAHVEALLDIMHEAIRKDGTLLVSGFGKFEAYAKEARKGRNPHTGGSLTLPARRVVVFRLPKRFRAELNA